ncbi:hypothetical protein T439DRAFT_343087 [Meredithblackwellia eburnea MCA 4105]
MNETDAGDYAIGEAHVPPTTTNKGKGVASQTPTFGIPAKLEPYVLLAKSARGAAATALINQAISAPGVYVFSELLAIPSIKDLATNEQHSKGYRLLELFAYGNWLDYTSNRESYPTLTKPQETKLKHLTVLSLASESRVIPYAHLQKTLELTSIPELEDLLIDAFYSNVLRGRLDQKECRLEVISGLGRDVRPSSVPVASTSATPAPASTPADAMEVDDSTATSSAGSSEQLSAHSIQALTQSLTSWLSSIAALLGSLDKHIATLSADMVNDAAFKIEQEKAVNDMITEVNTAKEKEGKEKEKEKGGDKDKGSARAGSWVTEAGSLLSRMTGGAAARDTDMEVDGAAGSSAGRGVKSPGGVSGRTRKRGRI